MADMLTELERKLPQRMPYRGLSSDWPRAVRVAARVARRTGRRHRVFRKDTLLGLMWAIREVGAPDA